MDLFMSVWTFAHVAPLDSPTNIFALQNESLLPQVLASLCGHPGPKMWCLGNRSSCGSGKSTGGRRLGIEKHTHTSHTKIATSALLNGDDMILYVTMH